MNDAAMRMVLAYRDWCEACRRYQPHSGWVEGRGTQPTVGICAGCGRTHRC